MRVQGQWHGLGPVGRCGTGSGFGVQWKVQRPALVYRVTDNVSPKPGLIEDGMTFESRLL